MKTTAVAAQYDNIVIVQQTAAIRYTLEKYQKTQFSVQCFTFITR